MSEFWGWYDCSKQGRHRLVWATRQSCSEISALKQVEPLRRATEWACRKALVFNGYGRQNRCIYIYMFFLHVFTKLHRTYDVHIYFGIYNILHTHIYIYCVLYISTQFQTCTGMGLLVLYAPVVKHNHGHSSGFGQVKARHARSQGRSGVDQ